MKRNIEGNFYHILNRGVEKRKIFLDEKDYLRFVHNLKDFNDDNNALPYLNRRRLDMLDVRRPIVNILC